MTDRKDGTDGRDGTGWMDATDGRDGTGWMETADGRTDGRMMVTLTVTVTAIV